jgi:GNAT superfamily N-acetyltransferase
MKAFETRYGKYLISDCKRRLDPVYVYNLLCTPTATSQGLPASRFPIIVRNSLCMGVYDGDKQIGYARIITDYSEFATIWDVFIDEPYRKKGMGKALMQAIMGNPKIKGVYRWFLMTENAHSLYEKYGFKREMFNPAFMMYVNQNAAT